MILTEEEAKTKWCPFEEEGKCIASACMAWRWAQVEEANPNDVGTVRMDSHPGLPQHLKDAGAYKDRRIRAPRGFCGLAGKAEL